MKINIEKCKIFKLLKRYKMETIKNDQDDQNKNMAIEVYLNKKKLCTASLKDTGSVSANTVIFFDSNEILYLDVGGYSSLNQEYVDWGSHSLKIGDKVKIKLIFTSMIDDPTERKSAEEMNKWAQSLRPNANKHSD